MPYHGTTDLAINNIDCSSGSHTIKGADTKITAVPLSTAGQHSYSPGRRLQYCSLLSACFCVISTLYMYTYSCVSFFTSDYNHKRVCKKKHGIVHFIAGPLGKSGKRKATRQLPYS